MRRIFIELNDLTSRIDLIFKRRCVGPELEALGPLECGDTYRLVNVVYDELNDRARAIEAEAVATSSWIVI